MGSSSSPARGHCWRLQHCHRSQNAVRGESVQIFSEAAHTQIVIRPCLNTIVSLPNTRTGRSAHTSHVRPVAQERPRNNTKWHNHATQRQRREIEHGHTIDRPSQKLVHETGPSFQPLRPDCCLSEAPIASSRDDQQDPCTTSCEACRKHDVPI